MLHRVAYTGKKHQKTNDKNNKHKQAKAQNENIQTPEFDKINRQINPFVEAGRITRAIIKSASWFGQHCLKS